MSEQVVLGWVDPGDVSGRFMDSVLRWQYASQEDVRQHRASDYAIAGHIRLETGPRIAPARNAIVRRFLCEERFAAVEWLLMVDADMVYPADFIGAIMRDTRNDAGQVKRPVVGGLYFGGGHGAIFPVMYRMIDPRENDGRVVAHVTEFSEGEIVEVDACGTGALLMHRGVLEHLATIHSEPAPWFAESMYKPEGATIGQEFGEDWTFCVRVRSQGVPVYVNTGAKAGHMKSVELNEATWRSGQIGLANIAAAPEGARPEKPHLMLIQNFPNREQRRAGAKARPR